MRARALARLAAALGAAAVLAGPRASAEESAPTPVAAASAVVRAIEGGDDADARAAANDARVSPFVVLNEFLARVPLRAGTPKGEAMLVAAERWATLVRDREEGRAVAALVARWRGLTKEDLRAEQAVYEALLRAGRRIADRDLEGLEAEVREARPKAAAATWSVSAVVLFHQAARALSLGGHERAAESAYEDLARQAEAVGWVASAVEGWDQAGGLAHRRRDYDRAAEDASRVAAAERGRGHLAGAARAQLNVGVCRYAAGRHAEALAAVLAALEGARAASSALLETEALALEASVQSALGQGARALAAARAMRATAARVEDADALRRVLFMEGHELLRLDAWEEALEVFDTLAPLVAGTRNETERFLLERALAQLQGAMGRPEAAEPHARALVAVAKEARDDDAVAEALAVLALVLTQEGKDAEASAVFAEAGAAAPGDRRGADAWAGEAEAARRSGRAAAAVAAARRAVAAYERLDVPPLAAQARLTLARLLLDAGDRAEALEVLAAAQAALAVDPDRSSFGFLCARAGALAYEAADRPADAAAQARKGLRALRALSRGLAEGDAAGVRRDAEALADLGVVSCAAWAGKEPARAAEAADLAFDVAEEGRALFLAEGLANPDALLRRDLPPDLVAADLRTRRAVEDARDRSLRRRERPADDDRSAGDAALDLDAAWKERDAVLLRVQRAARRAAAFVEPPSPDAPALRAALRGDEALIAYALGSSRAAALVVRHDGSSVVDLGDAPAVRARLAGWLRLVATPDADDTAAAAALYDRLLRPLEPALAGASRWVVVPEGDLSFAPLDALLRVDGATSRRVVEFAAVSRAPSAGVWAMLRASGAAPVGDGVLAVGGPSGADAAGLPALPGALAEAQEVAGRFPADRRALATGADASVDRVLALLSGRRLRAAHFACHGLTSPSRPGASGLLLAGGQILDVDRLARERVLADLVVLSACDSGRGRIVRGEGVYGLVRAFLLAGAPRVVGSDWVVSDRAARRFMSRFYDAWLARGLPADVALATAKRLAIADGGDPARPALWAAFSLWGAPE